LGSEPQAGPRKSKLLQGVFARAQPPSVQDIGDLKAFREWYESGQLKLREYTSQTSGKDSSERNPCCHGADHNGGGFMPNHQPAKPVRQSLWQNVSFRLYIQ